MTNEMSKSLMIEVRELGMHSPIVHSCIMSFEHGHCTFEHAMMMCVVELSKQNNKLIKSLSNVIAQLSPLPGFIPNEK